VLDAYFPALDTVDGIFAAIEPHAAGILIQTADTGQAQVIGGGGYAAWMMRVLAACAGPLLHDEEIAGEGGIIGKI
jgi:hypothetical protein